MKLKKQILFITSQYDKLKGDGVSNVISNLNNTLNKKNYLIEIVDKNTFIKKIIYFKKSDIIFFHGCWHPIFFISLIINFFYRKKIILHSHGMLSEASFKSKFFYKKIMWYLYQKKILNISEKIIVSSKKEYFEVRKLIFFKRKISVIPNGIIYKDFKNFFIHNLKDKKIIKCFFFSRVHKQKGIEELIKSWSLIKHPKLRLTLFGSGDALYEKYLKDLVSKNKNKKNITISFQKKIKKNKIYQKNSILILPTYSESFGLVILEALFSGNIVITSKFTPWNFLKKNSLIYFTDINPLSISKKINFVLNNFNNKKYKKDYNFLHNYIKKNFLWEKISKNYVKLISEIKD